MAYIEHRLLRVNAIVMTPSRRHKAWAIMSLQGEAISH